MPATSFRFFQFCCAPAAVLLSSLLGPAASGVQFSFLDPAYTQQIYAGPNVGIPGAWTSTNQLIARKSGIPDIVEYNATPNTVYQGTNLHGVTVTHTIAGLASGANITRGTNGFLYLPTQAGLQRVDPSNWATPAATVTTAGGPGYGVNALPNGNIVYAAGGGSTDIRIYNPTANTDVSVFTAPALIDDIETSLTGLIALAGQGNNTITLLNSAGGLIQTFPTTNFPDGLAFATMASPPALYSNDNRGTITRYDFASGYTAAPTNVQVIASGGSYGDIATPGPDCAFYVTQFFNNGINGSALFGTTWDNNVVNNDSSIIRIGAKQGCLFDPPVGFSVPEPNSLAILALALSLVTGVRQHWNRR